MNVSFDGLSSGMEWGQIVDELLQLEARPIERYEDRIEEHERTQDTFRDLNNRTANLLDHVGDLTDPDTFEAMDISNTHEDVLSASIVDSEEATEGIHEVHVENLATRARVRSGSFVQNQKMATADGETSRSDFQVTSDGSLDLESTDFLDQLRYNVETTGEGEEDIMIRQDTAEGQVGVSIDLDSVESFSELHELINDPTISEADHEALLDYDAQGHAGDSRDTLADPENWSMQMQYHSGTDRFTLHAAESHEGAEGGRTFEVADDLGGEGFFQQIGFASDSTIHTFDQSQSEHSMNLLSADAGNLLENISFENEVDAGGTVRINNTEVDWNAGEDTLHDVIDRIDQEVDGVNASYSSATDRVTLEAAETGSGDINVEDLDGNLADVLSLRAPGEEDHHQEPGNYTEGSDAEVLIDGDQVTSDGNTVTFDGIELELHELHTEEENPDNPVEVEVFGDTEGITQQVGEFINQYNSVMEFINEKSMPDPDNPDEAGPLASDSMPRNLATRMAQFVTGRYEEATDSGTIQSAADIGIQQVDPLIASDSDVGKLEFDAAQFQQALEENPDEVQALFTADTEEGDAQDGIATRLDSYLEGMTDPTDGLLQTRIEGFDDRITNLQDRIDRQVERVERKRDHLESQFMHMESMMEDLNAQQSSLQQSLGGGGGLL